MHRLQQHWDRVTRVYLLLLLASWLFGALAAVRRALYRWHILQSKKLPVPVIVVGNITVGGTGKTPLTLALAQGLIERGRQPLIISRGYRGASVFPQAVEIEMSAQQVGDEPLLMAQRGICPVWVGADRAGTARAALQENPQCDIVLCDDGLQHYRLQRDAEIAVIDGARGFGNGRLLPAGPLREPVSRLQTVDAVVVNGGNPAPGQFAMYLSGETFHNLLDPATTVSAAHFKALRVHAVAGIGNPQRYFQHLEKLGIAFTPHPFPDHHPYLAAELAFPDCDAVLLTEKDAVKCAQFADERFWVLRVDARFDPALLDHLLRKIESHGRQTA